MNKLFLFLVLFVSTISFAQKSKVKTAPKNIILATVDNVSAEVISEKSGKRVVLFVKNEGKIDTLEVKKLDKITFKPTNFTLKSYMTQGKKLYHVSWKE